MIKSGVDNIIRIFRGMYLIPIKLACFNFKLQIANFKLKTLKEKPTSYIEARHIEGQASVRPVS